MSHIVNLTPHALDLVVGGAVVASLPPSGQVARVSESERDAGTLAADGHLIPIRWVVSGGVVGLPEPRSGVIYVVSRIVAERVRDRDDVVFPFKLVRDDKGAVIGCGSFGRIA